MISTIDWEIRLKIEIPGFEIFDFIYFAFLEESVVVVRLKYKFLKHLETKNKNFPSEYSLRTPDFQNFVKIEITVSDIFDFYHFALL